MTTKEMMDIALELAGLDYIPEDSAINVEGQGVKRVLAGIDMNQAELIAAKMMGYDCVARHHPQGIGNIGLGRLESRDHCEIMINAGVPVNIAQKTAEPRKPKMDQTMHAMNLTGAVQLTRLLDLASISIHTPADLIVEDMLRRRMQALEKTIDRVTLKDIVDDIKQVREFAESAQGPEIRVGDEKSFAGRIFVTMTGGGACTLEEHKAMIDAGVGTFVVMHMTGKIIDALREDGRCNVVVAGHMASDSYGFNRILDAWEQRGVEVRRVGGIV